MGTKKFNFLLLYFISYMVFSFGMTEFTPYLADLGFDAMYRGIIISGYAITTIIFQLLFGFLSDYFQTIKKIVLISISVLAISSLLLFQKNLGIFIAQLLLISLSGGLINALCGLYDTWLIGLGDEAKNSLSFIKAFGSIGWAIGSVLASNIIARFMYSGLGVSILLLAILLIANLVILPDIESVSKKEKLVINDILALFKIPGYTLLIFILFLMYSMVVANSATVVDKMLYLNATNFEISLKWACGSLLEIPTYLLGAFLLRKAKAITLLHISSVMMIIQFILFGFATSSISMIIISLMQVFSTPVILLTSKMIIYDLSPDYLRNSSQLVALSLFMGVATLVVPSFAGFSIVNFGYNQTLFMVASFGLSAFFLIFILKNILNKKR